MNKNFSVKIPTTPFLKKFIQARYLEAGADAIKINSQSLLGVVIISCLNKEDTETRFTIQKKLATISQLTTDITCVAPWSLLYHYGNKITIDQAIQINRFFGNYFDEELSAYCTKYTAGNPSRYCGFDKAIYSFCEFYNIIIEEDINFDTLKKREYRLRKKINNNIFATLSPRFLPQMDIKNTRQQSLFVV